MGPVVALASRRLASAYDLWVMWMNLLIALVVGGLMNLLNALAARRVLDLLVAMAARRVLDVVVAVAALVIVVPSGIGSAPRMRLG